MLMQFRPQQLKPKPQSQPKERIPTLEIGVSLVRWGAGMLISQTIRRHKLASGVLQLASRRLGVVTPQDAVRELNALWADAEAVLETLSKKGCCYPSKGAYIFEQYLPRLWACEYCDGVHLEGPTCPGCGAGLTERPCQVVRK